MPTVNELVEQVARETGLDDTSGSDERAIIVSTLSRAYRRIGAEVNRLIVDDTTIPAALDTDLTATIPTLVTIDSVYRVDGDRYLPLDRTTPERLLASRETAGGGTPTAYAVEGRTLMLNTYETDDPSDIFVKFTARPGALSDGGSEASILGIDPIYHEDLLGTLATAYVLEGNEGEEQRAAYFRGLVYGDGGTMQLFKRNEIRKGGLYGPRGDDPTRWDTPAPRSAR